MTSLLKYNIDTNWTEETTLETNLTSLANAGTAVGAAITNGSNLALLADLSIQLASITSASPDYLEVHIIPLLGDGSTYADFFAGGPTLVVSISTTNGASAKALIARGIVIPPGTFKFGVVNEDGVTLSGTAPKCYYRLYDYTDNG